MNVPFFAMRNNHSSDCGEPPMFRNDVAGRYHGYFENAFGEQWVFVYDSESQKGVLCGGDAGWQQVIAVKDGQAEGVILGKEETEWLQVCWRVATGIR